MALQDTPRTPTALMRRKWLVVTLLVAALAFAASPHGPLGGFWRPSPDLTTPTGIQVPLFILLNASEAVVFGLGVSFLLFGYPLVRATAGSTPALTTPTYLAIGWLLVNWWPHDSLHVANGMNLSGLLRIEYGFHITLMLAAAVVARFFYLVVVPPGGPPGQAGAIL